MTVMDPATVPEAFLKLPMTCAAPRMAAFVTGVVIAAASLIG